jgi:hypothetical protein
MTRESARDDHDDGSCDNERSCVTSSSDASTSLVPMADTAMMLEWLAARRGIAVGCPSRLLRPVAG